MKTYRVDAHDPYTKVANTVIMAMRDINMKPSLRIAAMNKGLVVLPDTGNDMTEKEVLKALGISKTSNSRYTTIKVNTSSEPQETEKTKIDIEWNGTVKKWLLSPEQLRLLQTLDDEGFLDPEVNYSLDEEDYEEI